MLGAGKRLLTRAWWDVSHTPAGLGFSSSCLALAPRDSLPKTNCKYTFVPGVNGPARTGCVGLWLQPRGSGGAHA
eukprot:scaffold237358_cov14-Tisochrysis_lutea.AAC.1